jgi:hypothetical protein
MKNELLFKLAGGEEIGRVEISKKEDVRTTDSWIKELKVGDRIIVGHPFRDHCLAYVDRITPSGRIVVGNRAYLPDGRQYGGDKFASYYLVKYDEAKASIIEDKENIKYLFNFDYKKLSPEVRAQLVDIMKKGVGVRPW